MRKVGEIVIYVVIILFVTSASTLIAVNIGGNYFTEFEFLNYRGYEATGLLGGVIGFILVSLILYLIKLSSIKK